MPRVLLLLACCAAVALAAAGCGGEAGSRQATTGPRDAAASPAPRSVPAPPAPTTDLPADVAVRYAGRGADGAWVLRPRDAGTRRLPVVLFAHGWFAVNPEAYRGWVAHLVRAGNEVLYPTYQAFPYASPGAALDAFVAGVRAGLELDGAPVDAGSLVAVGHSAGGALAADYATVARAERLPVPRALLAAYPGRKLPRFAASIPERDPARIPADVELLAFGGADDTTVGTAPARRLVRRATEVPRDERRYVLVRDPAVADHLGPQRDGRASRRTFWRAFDELTRRARRGARGAAGRRGPTSPRSRRA